MNAEMEQAAKRVIAFRKWYIGERIDETELEPYCDDYAVRMVAFARQNKNLQIGEFADKAKELHWVQSLSETEAQCFVAFGCIVWGKLNDVSRVKIWDFIFSGDAEENYPSIVDGEASRIMVDAYYERTSPKRLLDGVIAACNAWWHRTPAYEAITGVLLDGKSECAAYVASVCAA